MTKERQRSSTQDSGSLIPLDDFVALSANVMDAHTVALFAADTANGCLRMVAGWSLSDHLIPDAAVSLQDTLLGTQFHASQPRAEAHFDGDATTLGMYSQPEPIRAYMTVPVGARGLLWIDTRQAYQFTGKHLKILSDLARTAEHLLRLSARMRALHQVSTGARVMRQLLDYSVRYPENEDKLLDAAVNLSVESMGLHGALTAMRLPHRDLCKITACCGLPEFVQVGRLVRFRQGSVRGALDSRKPVFAYALTDDEPDVVAFHARERFGFPVRSLAIIPWRVEEQDRDYLLILVSARPDKIGPEVRESYESLVDLIRLIETASLRKRLLVGVRRYDAESGVLSEGAFCFSSREMLSKARDRGTSLALVLMEIANIEQLYMDLPPATVNRFLELVTDTMRLLQPRPAKVGKFKTGGFGLLVENAKEHEVLALHKKAQYLFGTGYLTVGGREIPYGMAMAAAHFPGDCSETDGLWSTARARLALPKSTLYRWSSLQPRSTNEAGGPLDESREPPGSVDFT